ncbi:MAG TPA: hypothetical protein VMR25_02065, partial [Planctomycetaceae bacterium]|nr:hypothetical protein [Planctomycetaceae bacterium]
GGLLLSRYRRISRWRRRTALDADRQSTSTVEDVSRASVRHTDAGCAACQRQIGAYGPNYA